MSHVLSPTTNLKTEEQLQIVRGDGIYLYDDNGKEFIEGLSGLWRTGLGHGSQELIDACARVMKTISFAQSFGGLYSRWAHELGDALDESYADLKARGSIAA